MKISFTIQAATAAQRVVYVPILAARLTEQIAAAQREGLQVEGPYIACDTAMGGPWQGFLQAWASAPSDTTHRVILQDDVRICADLPQTVWRLVQARPEAFISGFLPWSSCVHAMAQGRSWVATPRFAWAQCLVIPVALGNEAIRWVAELEAKQQIVLHTRPWGRSCDKRLQDFLRATHRLAYVAVPHLVDHIDDELGGSTIAPNLRYLKVDRHARPGTWLGETVRLADRPWRNLEAISIGQQPTHVLNTRAHTQHSQVAGARYSIRRSMSLRQKGHRSA